MADNDTVQRDRALGGLLALAGTIALGWGLWMPGADVGDPECHHRPLRTGDICHAAPGEPGDAGATYTEVAQHHDQRAHRNKTVLELGGGVVVMVGAVLVCTATKD